MKNQLAQLWKHFAGSALCGFVLVFVLINWAVATWQPLRFITTSKYVPLEKNPLVSKLPMILDGSEKSDVMVIGSSLPMWAIAFWDGVYARSIDCSQVNNIWRYSDARYLKEQIKNRTGVEANVLNLTSAACMVSDAELILSTAIASGKAPKVVIYGIGPRDFSDNLAPKYGYSPVYQLLGHRMSLPTLLSSGLSKEAIADSLIGSACYYYKVKTDYRTMLLGATCDVLHRPADLFEASHLIKQKAADDAASAAAIVAKQSDQPAVTPDVTVGSEQQSQVARCEGSARPAGSRRSQQIAAGRCSQQTPSFSDLPEWKQRYVPGNMKRFDKETIALHRIVDTCRRNHIKLIVASMPLTAQNKAIIPAESYARYKKEMAKLPAEYDVDFIDLDSDHLFDLSNFTDSAHPNASGGRKIQDKWVDRIVTGDLVASSGPVL